MEPHRTAAVPQEIIIQDFLLKSSPHRMKGYQKRWVQLSSASCGGCGCRGVLRYYNGRQRLRGLGLRAETQEAGHAAQLGVQITKDVPSLRWARGPIGAGEAVGMRDGQKADVVKGTRGGRAAAHLFAEHAAHHA